MNSSHYLIKYSESIFRSPHPTLNNREKKNELNIIFVLLKVSAMNVVRYFKNPECNVCVSHLPQIEAMISQKFPQLKLQVIDCAESPELCAQHSIFTVPVVEVVLEGQMIYREARIISLYKLEDAIQRPYEILFE